LVCDKLKVCDADRDPWRKLANVLWVFADRATRIVIGSARTTMAGPMRERLAQVWNRDPHFDGPDLFVEAREGDTGPAPAYYLAATWLAREEILPPLSPAIFDFDPRLWSRAIAESGRDPVFTVVRTGEEIRVCPRCGAPLSFAAPELLRRGLAVAHHGLPLPRSCAPALHVVIDGSRFPPPAVLSRAEQIGAVEGRTPLDAVPRLCDRVAEPEDHAH
jgi:hypothetical protein